MERGLERESQWEGEGAYLRYGCGGCVNSCGPKERKKREGEREREYMSLCVCIFVCRGQSSGPATHNI